MIKLILLLCCLFSSLCFSETYTVRLGTEKVRIKVWRGRGKTFVHLHQNEITALKAAKSVIKKEGGSLLTLQHSGQRTIAFSLKNQRYEFDPNRIFTDKGIRLTLQKYSHYSPQAFKEVKKLAHQILVHLPKGRVIAVHNNQEYSIKDYFAGHKLAKDAKNIHHRPENYYRNFYLVTQSKDFKNLKKLGFNSVLQDKKASDDGSLSVLYANKHYVNVEAGYHQLAEQIRMLKKA